MGSATWFSFRRVQTGVMTPSNGTQQLQTSCNNRTTSCNNFFYKMCKGLKPLCPNGYRISSTQNICGKRQNFYGKQQKNLRWKHKKSMAKHKNLWQKNKKNYGKVFPLIYSKMTLLAKSCLQTVAICHKFTKNRHSLYRRI